MVFNLEAKFDSRKSFYNKAKVEIVDNYQVLYSYDTKVCIVTQDKKEVLLFNTDKWSQTTTRHIKEFLLQNNRKAENKKQILTDYKIY